MVVFENIYRNLISNIQTLFNLEGGYWYHHKARKREEQNFKYEGKTGAGDWVRPIQQDFQSTLFQSISYFKNQLLNIQVSNYIIYLMIKVITHIKYDNFRAFNCKVIYIWHKEMDINSSPIIMKLFFKSTAK